MTGSDSGNKGLSILIVDDEEAARYGIYRALSGFGYKLAEAKDADSAREKINEDTPDLILLDINLPGTSGMEFLKELTSSESELGLPLVVMITAHGSERLAVDAIKAGAHDYLPKPFEVEELRQIVKNALETVQLRRENLQLRQRVSDEAEQRGLLLGNSAAMQRVKLMIQKVAETDATVLLQGESGTGKELVAREIHERSSLRRLGSFVAINCAALPSELIESELFGHEKGAFTGAAMRRQGKFEQANGGTLFLDEIGDMSTNLQAKLLRALEERKIERLGGSNSIPVDVRIISATHRNLEEEIDAERFRPDLFYRLRVVAIDIPPLRERTEDIPLLTQAFMRTAAEHHDRPVKRIGASAMRRLLEYGWPGNVRELRNVMERAVILAESEELNDRDLPDELVHRPTGTTEARQVDDDDLAVPYNANFREDKREFERRYIARCLEETGGNVTRAAAILGMHRQSLQHKLRELGMARRYVTTAQEKSDG